MNLILFDHSDRIDPHHIRLAGDRLRHVQQTLKSEPGDVLRVGEIGGLIGSGIILEQSNDHVTLAVDLNETPPEKLPIRLFLALPRPKQLRRILRTVAEMGAAELHLINSYRVEKSYWHTPALESEAVRDYFLQGLSQARDTVMPALHLHKRFKPFVEDDLPGLIAGQRSLVAHPGDHAAFQPDSDFTNLFVGPEGGFIPFEIEKLQAAGCAPVSLGARILRVENAVTHLLGRFL